LRRTSSTTKTGRHYIAEILLKVALKHNESIKSLLALSSKQKILSKYLSSHQRKGKIHFITVHIIRMKPFIDTVKKSSKKNLYYVSYFKMATRLGETDVKYSKVI
jgi:hypothetical protein